MVLRGVGHVTAQPVWFWRCNHKHVETFYILFPTCTVQVLHLSGRQKKSHWVVYLFLIHLPVLSGEQFVQASPNTQSWDFVPLTSAPRTNFANRNNVPPVVRGRQTKRFAWEKLSLVMEYSFTCCSGSTVGRVAWGLPEQQLVSLSPI